MATHNWLSAAVGVVLVGLASPASPARSLNNSDKMMYLTFSRPVSLPGVTLGSGTYIFELPDPLGAWNVVRVSSKDRRVVYLTAFTRIVDRPKALSREQPISLGEARGLNTPQPIQVWWPASEPTGREFIY